MLLLCLNKTKPELKALGYRFAPGHPLLASALTYKVTGHLLVLLHPAHVAELQEVVHVVLLQCLEQRLQKSMSLITGWHR